ncbi:MAG: NAD-binding protein [Candidatus Cloacimonetes bacterium]|nr:NAD-binding protein [Candidatus Cloacimonadota bacterium]
MISNIVIKKRKKYPKIRKLLSNKYFNSVIVTLVILSVIILLLDVFNFFDKNMMMQVSRLNDFITSVLVFELILKWFVSNSNKKFLARNWIEILAVLPLLRVFRFGRLAYAFRLLRLFSLGTILQKKIGSITGALQSKLLEYSLLIGLMTFAILFGTVGFAQFEGSTGLIEPSEAFWKALFSLFSGEYADYPQTLGGKFVLFMLLVFEMTFFAMLTGTISAVMVEKFKETGMQKINDASDCVDHIVICGFNPKVNILVREFSIDPIRKDSEIIIISQKADLESLKSQGIKTDMVMIMQEDYTHIDVLKRSGINTANLAIVLSEPDVNRSTHDMDARTILSALTIEKMNSKIHTCAEINHPEYIDHLKMGGVDDVVIEGDVSGRLLARMGSSRGILPFFEDVLSNQSGNTMHFHKLPSELIGKSMSDALAWFCKNKQSIAVAVRSKSGDLVVNPRDYLFQEGDDILTIIDVNTRTSD